MSVATQPHPALRWDGRALAILDQTLLPGAEVWVALEGAARVTTFGPGILVVALAGGIANVAAAQLIRRRAGRRADRVD